MIVVTLPLWAVLFPWVGLLGFAWLWVRAIRFMEDMRDRNDKAADHWMGIVEYLKKPEVKQQIIKRALERANGRKGSA